jgi:hypothetical protein
MLLFQRIKTRRHSRTREARQATDWLAKVAETGIDAVTAPTSLATPGHLPPPRYAHVQRAPFGRRPSTPRRRVIELRDGQAVTQQIPRIPAAAELKPVPAPLPMRRAPQPASTSLTPVAESQQRRGGTWVVKVPTSPSYAERLAAVFDDATNKLTSMSGWVFNRTADDVAVTARRFAVLDGAIAALGAI